MNAKGRKKKEVTSSICSRAAACLTHISIRIAIHVQVQGASFTLFIVHIVISRVAQLYHHARTEGVHATGGHGCASDAAHTFI